MRTFILICTIVVLFAAPAMAQTYAVCSVWETTASYKKSPLQTSAYCETGNEGGGVWKNCTVEVGAQAPDLILDPSDQQYVCNRITGDQPCRFVQPGPLVFESSVRAKRTFSTNSERVGLVQYIGQLRREANPAKRIQDPFPIRVGRQFTVKRLRSAVSVILECKGQNGEQIIAPVSLPGENANDRVKFVRTRPAEPYDLFVYEVARQ